MLVQRQVFVVKELGRAAEHVVQMTIALRHSSASKPSFAIEHYEDRSLRIVLSPDPTGDQDEMIAVRREPGPKYGNTPSIIVRRSQSPKGAEQALSLLRSYIRDDDEFESLVDWVDQDGESSNEGD